ncbi:hypothetical protein GW796_08485 [archaeon]|nr:hypothetical protein [archaeon]
MEVYSGNNNSWYYEIRDMKNILVGGGKEVIDNYRSNPEKDLINNELTGFTLAVVFADNPNKEFELVFNNIEIGWK